MIKAKVILVLIDGVGDLRIPEFGGKTSLEYASTPTMDIVAKTGIAGLHDPVGAGYACGSDTSHMSIFGYDPFKYYKYSLY